MKKNILGLLFLTCCALWFASCSDDENGGSVDVPAGNMRVSAVFPESLTDDSLGLEMNGHQLRFIIELWTKGDAGQLAYRTEQLVTPVEGQRNATVEIPVAAGLYDCLMWADYIDAGASSQTGEGGGNRYTDKYYDTSDLHNVRVKDMNALVDNNACDAFFYACEVNKGGDACLLDVEMMRPFTRVRLMEKYWREFSLLQGLNATFTSYPQFNVATGTVGEETAQVNVNYPNFDPSTSSNGTLFSTYIFANAESRNWGNVEVTFTTEFHGTQTVTVPDIVPLLRGNHVKVSGNMMAESPEPDTEFEIHFDIDVEDWLTDVVDVDITGVAAKVGDYFFADGTWSGSLTEANKDNCVGIIFALGTGIGDDINNYGPEAAGKKIVGYVVALDNTKTNYEDMPLEMNIHAVSGRPMWYRYNDNGTESASDDTFDSTVTPFEAPEAIDARNFVGYTNTEGFLSSDLFTAHATDLSYPALQVFKKWCDTDAVTPANTSGWYIPSMAQLLRAIGSCYSWAGDDTYPAVDVDEAFRTSFLHAVEMGIATNFTTGNHYMHTSTLGLRNPAENAVVLFNGTRNDSNDQNTTTRPQTPRRVMAVIRPMLTIIE